jgi:penicillin-binding protein 2
MSFSFSRLFKKTNFSRQEILAHEVLIDTASMSKFSGSQFEGRLEKSISFDVIRSLGICFLIVGFILTAKVWNLQVANGDENADKSENNRLRHELVFSERGLIYDRNNVPLAWNVPREGDFSLRAYINSPGLGHLLGYVSYPKKDKKGYYFDEELIGKDGVELYYESQLNGVGGLKITETNALGKVLSESVLRPPESGKELTLSVDSRIQEKLHDRIVDLSHQVGFVGGVGAIMNIQSGEIIAYTSYPEYSPAVMSDAKDATVIRKYFNDPGHPFINRLVQGLYTPGSIVKPFIAVGALEEKTIDPLKQILSTGKLEVPNPYDASKPSVFTDWKAHGLVDMRHALSVSSNIYFYEVGGGYGTAQQGLGISRIEKYMRMFGFGSPFTGFFESKAGVVPNPEWKKENFKGDDWRLGDTYFTSIGQYGFQIVPLQELRAITAIANGGKLVEPTILKMPKNFSASSTQLALNDDNLQVVRDGMRLAAIEGTGKALDVDYTEVAVKTGTAELGVSKANVNSWNTGFWPYKNPKYAFVVMMEKGSRTNTIGSAYIMRQLLDWMHINTPEYFQ